MVCRHWLCQESLLCFFFVLPSLFNQNSRISLTPPVGWAAKIQTGSTSKLTWNPSATHIYLNYSSLVFFVFVSLLSHSSLWAALRRPVNKLAASALRIARLKTAASDEEVTPTLKPRLSSVHFKSFQHLLFFSNLLILHLVSCRTHLWIFGLHFPY